MHSCVFCMESPRDISGEFDVLAAASGVAVAERSLMVATLPVAVAAAAIGPERPSPSPGTPGGQPSKIWVFYTLNPSRVPFALPLEFSLDYLGLSWEAPQGPETWDRQVWFDGRRKLT